MTTSGMGWSQPLTLTNVVEKLQQVIYDLHVVAARERKQFGGIAFTEVMFVDPEGEKSYWRVVIEPQGLVEVEVYEEDADDEDVRTASG